MSVTASFPEPVYWIGSVPHGIVVCNRGGLAGDSPLGALWLMV